MDNHCKEHKPTIKNGWTCEWISYHDWKSVETTNCRTWPAKTTDVGVIWYRIENDIV